MKKFFISLVAVMALVISCDKKPEVKLDPVYFESVALYKADNAFLPIDYVKSNLKAENSVDFTLPSSVYADSLETVVVAFKLSDTTAVVALDGEELSLVKDSLDVFRVETDGRASHTFLLSLNGAYAEYSLNISVAESNWTLAASSVPADTLKSDLSIAYDNASDKFYISSVKECKVSDDEYPVLYTFANNTLSSQTVIADLRSAMSSVAVSPSGDVYVAYDGYKAKAYTVAKMTNNGFVTVGQENAIYQYATTTPATIYPFSDNAIWVAGQNKAQKGGLARRLLSIASYDGTQWTNEVSIPGRDATHYAMVTRSAYLDGTYYMLVMNQNAGSISIYKNSGSSWATVCENKNMVLEDGTLVEGDKSLSYFGDFTIGSDGTFYIANQCKFDGTNWGLAVTKISADASEISVMGVVPASNTANGTLYPAIAVDSSNVPYVCYRDDATDRLYVSHYESEFETMTAPEAVSTAKVARTPRIAFDKSGKGYMFSVTTDDVLEIYSQK